MTILIPVKIGEKTYFIEWEEYKRHKDYYKKLGKVMTDYG